jgi:KipI family sensor histidine kinase inhibitor
VLIQRADDLLSLPVAGPPQAQALAAHLRQQPAWLDVVAGIDSVVVRFDAAQTDAATAQRQIEEALRGGVPPLHLADELLEIPVVYGGDHGPDLDVLCGELGISSDEFVALHTGREYRVDMIGFTPGFAFIGGLDDRLRVPRRQQPRQRVEAGSIGIADGRTGIYSVASPGGWTLVGRTPSVLFDAKATDPFRIRAGMRIRFRPVAVAAFAE